MKINTITSLLLVLAAGSSFLFGKGATEPTAPKDLVFKEVDGLVAIEAEHFISQELSQIRAWHLVSPTMQPNLKPDIDTPHVVGSSGNAYLEALPDTRWTHDEDLIAGENFFREPGLAGILSYKIHFDNPGRYYVWVRHFSTGTEDNGIHVGLNDEWPDSGKRWQTVIKRQWAWESRQRTEQLHSGEPFKLYLEIPSAGEHTIHFSMREDGFEFDKFILALDRYYIPENLGPASIAKSGTIPKEHKLLGDYTEEPITPFTPAKELPLTMPEGSAVLRPNDFNIEGTNYYLDRGKWLAINPEKHKSASAKTIVPVGNITYDIILHAVGENDGGSTFTLKLADKIIGEFYCPMSRNTFEEGLHFSTVFKNIDINEGEIIEISSNIVSDDGKEYCRGRFAGLTFVPSGTDNSTIAKIRRTPITEDPNKEGKDVSPVSINGELKQWHKVTLDLEGPQANELDDDINPFTEYRFEVQFTHESGSPSYLVPGYFAADGNAANTSATSGNIWRAHLSPDKAGGWIYEILFHEGPRASIGDNAGMQVAPFHGISGSFNVSPTDKAGRDFRGQGRLQYVGKHHLQFAGSKNYFLKAGPDAPETLLAYIDFDNTETRLPKKGPLKSWSPHIEDWQEGDPTWKNGKGKALVGALNYLASKGVNAFSFLTYNAGGDGDNIWPYVNRDDKFRFDCSKLDQWGILFDHAQANGLYLHFKLQENEMDDNRAKSRKTHTYIPEALDGGNTGPERKLYLRELIARFGYQLALNWNIGEENTQSLKQQNDMAEFIRETDPYDHLRIIHTFPGQQDPVYTTHLGPDSLLNGVSLQNPWDQTHQRSLKWIRASAASGAPWIVPNDEQNPAGVGVPPDPGYKGFSGMSQEGPDGYDIHDIRKLTLWGNLMAGGSGVEYYFGYKMLENDLLCEDFRSRDRSWDFCRIAIDFFKDESIPFWDMSNANALIGNTKNDNSRFCLAKSGEIYLVYLPEGGTADIDLSTANGSFKVQWFDPRNGGKLQKGSKKQIRGGKIHPLGKAPSEADQDWLIVIRK
ncbi:DUF5060 domain-containing protein [Puniceicoccaceae bacterium K14]|nr:DUF5060 domain-containing protein [Puniceicoccaceae bacterium K14]